MERWLLLALSAFAVYGVIESFRWLRLMQRSSIQEVERVVGYDGSRLPADARVAMGGFAQSRVVSRVCIIMVMLAMGLIVATVRAFLA